MIPLLADGTDPVTFDLTAALPPAFAFARAGNAWSFDGTGTLVQHGTDVPRFARDPATLASLGLLVEPSRTNGVRNPRGEGASAGTPGTPPTNWTVGAGSGIASSIVGTGTESGIPYLDVRFQGTATATANLTVVFEGPTTIAAVSGQAWTASGFVRLIAGAFGGTQQAPQWIIQEYNSGGSNLAQQVLVLSPAPTGAALATQRRPFTATLGNALTAFTSFLFFVQYGIGASCDFTLRIGLPQMELGGFATSPILPPAASPAASTRAADDLTLPLAGLPFWQGGPGFGAMLEFSLLAAASLQSGVVVWGVSPTSGFNDSWYATVAGGGVLQLVKINGGSGATSTNTALGAAGAVQRLAVSGVPGVFTGSLNGAAVMTAANAGYPAMLRQGLLRAPWGIGNVVAGHARRLRLFARPLADAQLQRESAP